MPSYKLLKTSKLTSVQWRLETQVGVRNFKETTCTYVQGKKKKSKGKDPTVC